MKDRIFISLALVGLCACRPDGVDGVAPVEGRQRSAPVAQPASLYQVPPTATATHTLSAGRLVRLVGQAEPGSRIRLASPGGQTVFADTGRDGVWRIDVPSAAATRLFGLAMLDRGHVIQSEGYIAVTPQGESAQLRAGAGAVSLDSWGAGPLAISAVDFDSKGGAVVSGRASSHAAMEVLVDGGRQTRGVAAADGRFSLALNEPLELTEHRFEVIDGSRHASARAALDRASPLSGGPYRSARTAFGWRIDWMTPGGGVQTTLLFSRDGVSA